MSALHVAVLNAFKSMNWQYRTVPDMEVVESGFEGYHGRITLHVQSFPEAEIVAVVATASATVPAGHRAKVAELLMRTNKELNLGAFEMDWDGGTVMFRQSNVFPKNRHDEGIIANLTHNAVAEMDRLTPFLGEIIRTKKDLLVLLDVPELMRREDLLPPAPPEGAAD
jgi:hypothetical protein